MLRVKPVGAIATFTSGESSAFVSRKAPNLRVGILGANTSTAVYFKEIGW